MANNYFLGALPQYEATSDSALPSPAYSDASAGSGTPVPNPSDVVTDKPVDVGGGSEQTSDPNVPKDENMEEDENKDAGDMFKISAPILLLGAAAAFYFFYLRKKK